MDSVDDTFYAEKISIEPDLGDQRKSTWKPLPPPPRTPKRVMMKYRFSAVFPIVFGMASFALTLLLVLAEQNFGILGGHYLVAVRTPSVVRTDGKLTESSWILTGLVKT